MKHLSDLWVCGDTLAELRRLSAEGALGEPLWSWDSRHDSGLTDEQRGWLSCLDEVKPVIHRGQPCILLCSSYRGGVALVRLADKVVLFVRPLRNAHSAELLPDGWIAMAGSTGSDVLTLASVETSEPVVSRGLPHGHGVVWDLERGLLWVGEWEHVRALRWNAGALDEIHAIPLPTTGSHDLMPDPRCGGLIVTTDTTVWRLDLQTREVSPFVPLIGQALVKSVSIDASSGAWCFVQGSSEHWWSDAIHVLYPDGSRHACRLPGRRLYKARWDRSCQMMRG